MSNATGAPDGPAPGSRASPGVGDGDDGFTAFLEFLRSPGGVAAAGEVRPPGSGRGVSAGRDRAETDASASSRRTESPTGAEGDWIAPAAAPPLAGYRDVHENDSVYLFTGTGASALSTAPKEVASVQPSTAATDDSASLTSHSYSTEAGGEVKGAEPVEAADSSPVSVHAFTSLWEVDASVNYLRSSSSFSESDVDRGEGVERAASTGAPDSLPAATVAVSNIAKADEEAPPEVTDSTTATSTRSPSHRADEGARVHVTAHADAPRAPTRFVHLAHALDALLGLACVVYGVLIATAFAEPATAAVAATLAYGSVLLAMSAAGTAGLVTRCGRGGLAVSQHAAPFVACLYAVVLGLGLGSEASDLDYAAEHAEALYLTAAAIAGLRRFLPLVYALLALLAVMEVVKSFRLHEIRLHMARLRSVENSNGRRADSRQVSTNTSDKKDESEISRSTSAHNTLTEPLLDGYV